MLSSKSSSFSEVVAVLTEYRRNIGDSSSTPSINGDSASHKEHSEKDNEGSKQRAIIGHLVDYLKSC